MSKTRIQAPEYEFNEEEKSLLKLTNWSPKTVDTLRNYLLAYDTIPDYKKVLRSMIKADQMYEPLTRSSLYPDILGDLKNINMYRKAQRAQVYMNKKDIIETVDLGVGKRLVLTSKGHKIFYKDYPLSILRKKKWDGIWTVVMYDFPEKIKARRQIFRHRLIRYGFGSPQISILISPLPLGRPVRELVKGEKLKEYVWVQRSEGVLGLKDEEIAKVAWPLTELNDLYTKLFEALPKIKKSINKKTALKGWGKFYLAVDSKDPYLPFELLPSAWMGEKCRKEFSKFSIARIISSIFSF
ncbi:MAG: PaaX family transcriptional regulator C-terminal domain-containing protein [Patescibacteria group bacterium]